MAFTFSKQKKVTQVQLNEMDSGFSGCESDNDPCVQKNEEVVISAPKIIENAVAPYSSSPSTNSLVSEKLDELMAFVSSHMNFSDDEKVKLNILKEKDPEKLNLFLEKQYRKIKEDLMDKKDKSLSFQDVVSQYPSYWIMKFYGVEKTVWLKIKKEPYPEYQVLHGSCISKVDVCPF